MDEIKIIREFIELAYGNYIGLHKSKIELLALLKEKEKAINYTRCCKSDSEQLKAFVDKCYDWQEKQGFLTMKRSDWYEYIESL